MELLEDLASAQTYSVANGQTCLDALQKASTQPGFCSADTTEQSACNGVFLGPTSSAGSASPGQPCMQDSDCAPASGGGAACLFSTGSDGGSAEVCVQTLPGKSGQGPCVGTQSGSVTSYSLSGAPPSVGYVCNTADGLGCSSTSMTCSPLLPTGQACTADTDCVTSDYCNFAAAGSSVCAPRVADGSACGVGGAECVATSYCDSTSGTCKPALANGAACSTSGSGAPCQSGLCVNGKCGGSSSLTLALLCGS